MAILKKFGNNSDYDAQKANIVPRKSKLVKEEESKLMESQSDFTAKFKKKNTAISELENAD